VDGVWYANETRSDNAYDISHRVMFPQRQQYLFMLANVIARRLVAGHSGVTTMTTEPRVTQHTVSMLRRAGVDHKHPRLDVTLWFSWPFYDVVITRA